MSMGTWLMNFYYSIMSTHNIKGTIDGNLKRIHIKVLDFTSSDDHSLIVISKKKKYPRLGLKKFLTKHYEAGPDETITLCHTKRA